MSIHDLSRTYTDNDLLEFINKYNRRFNRIIEYIKSNEKIIFIRNDVIDDNSRHAFIDTILKINPKCNFTLVIIDNNKENYAGIFKYKYCLYIKLNIDIPIIPDWTTNFLNWNNIFQDIENNISLGLINI